MPFQVIVENTATPPEQATWIYTTNVKLCVERPPYGRNAYEEKLVSAVVPGERICHTPGDPCHSRLVVSVTEF